MLNQGLYKVVPRIRKERLLLPFVWVGQNTLLLTVLCFNRRIVCLVYIFIVAGGEH